MTTRMAINCVEDAKKIAGHDAYRTVGGYVCIIDTNTGDEIFISDSPKKTSAFIRKLAKSKQEAVR